MIAVKVKGNVTRDHRLELQLPSSVPPGEVEVIVLRPEPPETPKPVKRKPQPDLHPAAGVWADREDICDTVTFVSKLRGRLETRQDAG
jgi:hypothetical protein